MVDPFMILAPFLVLGVMALIRFAGCLSLPTPPGPQLDSAIPVDDHSVLLTWEPVGSANGLFTGFNIKRGAVHGGPYTRIGTTNIDATTYTDDTATNTAAGFYVVSIQVNGSWITDDPDESRNSNELAAAGAVTVTFNNPGNADDPLSGVYNNELDFGAPGAQPWYWRSAGNNSAIYVGPPGLPEQ